MKTHKFGAVAVGAATAATVFVLGTAVAAAGTDERSSASLLTVGGVVSISPTPYAESRDGRHDYQELASLGVLPGLSGGIRSALVTAEAEGNRAEASVAKLDVLKLVTADAVTTWCDGDEGGLRIVNGRILGVPFSADQPPTTLDVSPLIKLELNKHTVQDGVLKVEGLKITVLPSSKPKTEKLDGAELAAVPDLLKAFGVDLAKAPVISTVGDLVDALGGRDGGVLAVTVGTVICTFDAPAPEQPAADEPAGDEPTGDEPEADAPAVPAAHREEAPAPVIVEHSLPVTG